MQLDRNTNANGSNKYALINLRKLNQLSGNVGTFEKWSPEVVAALKTLEEAGALELGNFGDANEFFVIKLKDVNAPGALIGYANSAESTDPEYAAEIREMLDRAGLNNSFCKQPD